MYFDPRPKTKKEDLFNRETELKQFEEVLPYASIIVVTGLRRTGKTSFVDVALSKTDHPYIFLDMRDLPLGPSRAEIVRKIESAFGKMDTKWHSSILDTLKHVKGVNIAGASMTFEWSKQGIDLTELFDKIDTWAKKQKKHFLLAIDEVQLIRGDKNIPRLFARIADVNRNITIILTGSEVGLLYDFLGFETPESPLYGRHYVEIRMRNFKPEEAKTFLTAGFKQIKLSCTDEIIDYAIQKLDGVIGWLTLFGARSRDTKKCDKQTVDDVVDEGGRLSRSEALKIVKYSVRYGIILNYLAKTGKGNWTKIKTALEIDEKRSLPSSSFTELLNRLTKTGLLEKEDNEYRIADPLLAHGIMREPF
ncbi:MAG TPA: ATP-binding protein [Candidatus Bathyarchaeia archaeon]|nr:ATP-binding protein [Candidatus Bathyarchaeia archaeon]